jgi:hypothetical protein
MRKKFDAVKFQRKIREELSNKYNTDREAFLNELKVKYGVLKKGRSARTSVHPSQPAKGHN